MHDGDQLIEPLGPAPRFAIAFRGYDRSQVDSWLSDHGREMGDVDVSAPLAETTRRQEALESRLAELQGEGEASAKVAEEASPESLAAHVLSRAHDIARELPDRIVRDAETERQRLEESTAQALETAHARSAQIIGEAERDREQIASMADEAREQIETFRRQAEGTARERVQRRWHEATAMLAGLEVELTDLKSQHQATLSELSALQKQLEASRAELRERDRDNAALGMAAPRGSLGPGPEHRRREPEHRRRALMPLEW